MWKTLLLCTALSIGPNLQEELELQAPSDDEERIPIDQILNPRRLRDYLRKTRYKDRIKVIREAVEDRADDLDDQIRDRNLAVVFRTLAEIRGLAATGLELSQADLDEKEQRDREVTRLEIQLRKLGEQLNSQSLSVPLENRAEFEKTSVLVEQLRNQLLRQLFGGALGDVRSSSEIREPFSALTMSFLAVSPAHSLASASPGAQGAIRGLHDIDRFTEEEFDRVQTAQKLVKRVEVFLEIAESRLAEIERRRDEIEWDEKEPNPLEFYTFDDLLHAYHRAVDGIMINIDSQAESGRAELKDLKKGLELLNEKVPGFVERLKAMEDYIRERRDTEFYRKWDQALKTSDIARQGAEAGLKRLEEIEG